MMVVVLEFWKSPVNIFACGNKNRIPSLSALFGRRENPMVNVSSSSHQQAFSFRLLINAAAIKRKPPPLPLLSLQETGNQLNLTSILIRNPGVKIVVLFK